MLKKKPSGHLEHDIALEGCDSLVLRSELIGRTGVERRAFFRVGSIICPQWRKLVVAGTRAPYGLDILSEFSFIAEINIIYT